MITKDFLIRKCEAFGYKQCLTITLLCALALIELAPGPVMAQESSDTLEVVTVTAERRTENMQDVPISDMAFSGQELAAGNITSIDDIINNTPNATFTDNGSRDRREISIRGVSNQLDPSGDVRPSEIATYYDGFNVSAAITNPEIVDMSSVEVLRGPQGTYYGRNAIGGAINVTTNMPTDNFEGHVGAGYANFNTLHQEGVINIPLTDTLAVRVAASNDTSDGHIKNINPIGGGDDSTYTTGRITLGYKPSDRLTMDLIASYTNEVVGMLDGVPTGFLTSFPRALYYGGSPTALADPDGVGFYPENRDRVNFNFPQRIGSKIWYTMGRGVYDITDGTELTLITGYITANNFNYGDVDGGSKDYFNETYPETRDSASAEVRLQTIGPHVLDWTAGALLGRDTGDSDQSTNSGAAFTAVPVGTEIGGQVSNAETRYYALYAEGTWHIQHALSATVGGRLSHDVIKENYVDVSVGQTVFTVNDAVSYSDFSPHFTLSYRPKDSLMLYATVSRGYKAGGVQTNPNVPSETYKPETLWNYEVGAKTQFFGNRLRANLSLFDLEWKNLQSQVRYQYLDNNVIETVLGVDNAASARSSGAEFSLDALLTRQLLVSVDAGYMNAKFLKFPNAYVDGAVINASGKPLVNAPRWTASAHTEYTFSPIGQFTPFLRAEWFYRAKTLSNVYGLRYYTWPFIAPAYNSTSLRAGVDTNRYNVTFYVENLFDNNYFTNAYEKAFYSGVQVVPSYRSYGVKLTYNF